MLPLQKVVIATANCATFPGYDQASTTIKDVFVKGYQLWGSKQVFRKSRHCYYQGKSLWGLEGERLTEKEREGTVLVLLSKVKILNGYFTYFKDQTTFSPNPFSHLTKFSKYHIMILVFNKLSLLCLY